MTCLFRSKRSHLIGPLGWLFIVLLLLQGPLPALVLCFGANGHVAVEVPHNRFPHPTSQSQTPCLDLPLISVRSDVSPQVAFPKQAAQRLVPMLASLAAPLPLFAGVLPSATLGRHTPPATLPGVPLPTVVLRI
jgi:hypothetical protein